MEAKAVAKYIRMSPRKVQQIINLIRGKDIKEALAILKYTAKGTAEAVTKVLNSAIANAEHNFDMNVDALYVSQIFVDQGPTLKRFKPRAMGRADVMRRRTSHVTVMVSEREGA